MYIVQRYSKHTCKAYKITSGQFTELLLDITQDSELI